MASDTVTSQNTASGNSGGTHAEAQRERILQAARKVFTREGGIGIGLRGIAREANCTTGAIYHWFDSKEDIYSTLLEVGLDDLLSVMAVAGSRHADARTALRASAMSLVDHLLEHEIELCLGLFMFERGNSRGWGPENDRRLNTKLHAIINLLSVGFSRVSAETPLSQSPDRMAQALHASLVGVLTLAYKRRTRSLDTTAEELASTVIDRFCPAASGPHPGEQELSASVTSDDNPAQLVDADR